MNRPGPRKPSRSTPALRERQRCRHNVLLSEHCEQCKAIVAKLLREAHKRAGKPWPGSR